tara:strand:+ start:16615 stop:17715 length:1101 start_codon:yes stop_codon:yes gene_type:complete
LIQKIYKINWLFIFIVIILASIGFIALYSAADSNFEPWARKQIIRFCVFFFLLFFIALVDIRVWYKYCYHIFILSLLLLLSVEIIGTFGFGAKRWIKFFGLSIQPSELIKVGLILFLARYYHDLRFQSIGRFRFLLLPVLVISFPFLLILIQPDLGTAIVYLFLGVIMMFLAGVRLWKFILSSIAGLSLIPLIWNYMLHDYQKRRLISFIDPESDPLGTGYHLIQSKIALGSGGIFGKGFLKGSQSYLDFLPEKQTDFIFTMIGEEFGFLGTIFIIILYMLMICICFYIAFRSFSNFGRLVSLGVATNLFINIFFNTSMVTGLMPVVGIPLPLLSYGGSAMLSVMISFGFLLNISAHSGQKNLEYD